MKAVTKRQLNQETAQVLARVADGVSVIVTERGVAKWRIEAVDTDPIQRLQAEGRLVTAKGEPAPWGPVEERRRADDVDALLDEMRGDR